MDFIKHCVCSGHLDGKGADPADRIVVICQRPVRREGFSGLTKGESMLYASGGTKASQSPGK